MPVWNILVSDPGGNVEHDDTAVTVDIVTVSQSSELLLASSIPHIELELTEVGEKTERAIGQRLSVSDPKEKDRSNRMKQGKEAS